MITTTLVDDLRHRSALPRGFVYLIARGHKMGEHAVQDAQEQDAAMRQYVQNVVSSDGRSTADEIARLADLRDRGAISEEEFQQAKAKAIS